jgi:hypothetical protein
LPGAYVSALARLGITGGGGIPFPTWSVEAALALMDRDNALALLPRLRARSGAA